MFQPVRSIWNTLRREKLYEIHDVCSSVLQFGELYEKMCGFSSYRRDRCGNYSGRRRFFGRTGEIADDYEIEYPDIVRVVHKENGGHGSGVNKGLELAEGIYFKVVDSDDWLDKESCQKLLVRIRAFTAERPDLIVCNYVYDHLDEGIKSMDYRNVFPVEQQCTWDSVGRFIRPNI